MKQLGMSQEDVPASRVIIEKTDDTRIIINNPSVTKIKMQGQETFQISGEIEETSEPKFTDEDIKTIVEKTSCSPEQAKETLEKTGDIAEAILELSR